jgi:hypothetical protein
MRIDIVPEQLGYVDNEQNLSLIVDRAMSRMPYPLKFPDIKYPLESTPPKVVGIVPVYGDRIGLAANVPSPLPRDNPT